MRLIRTACEKKGDEKSGYPLQFNTNQNRNGEEKNPLIHLRGSRVNVVLPIVPECTTFLRIIITTVSRSTNSLGTTNRLLKDVLDDASCDLYLAWCKALVISISMTHYGESWSHKSTSLIYHTITHY